MQRPRFTFEAMLAKTTVPPAVPARRERDPDLRVFCRVAEIVAHDAIAPFDDLPARAWHFMLRLGNADASAQTALDRLRCGDQIAGLHQLHGVLHRASH